jgi:hypothetical protein
MVDWLNGYSLFGASVAGERVKGKRCLDTSRQAETTRQPAFSFFLFPFSFPCAARGLNPIFVFMLRLSFCLFFVIFGLLLVKKREIRKDDPKNKIGPGSGLRGSVQIRKNV